MLISFQTGEDARKAISRGERLYYKGRGLRVMMSQARRHICLRRAELPFVWRHNELQIFFSQFGMVDRAVHRINGHGTVRFDCYGSYALAKEAVRSGTTPYAFW